jgi:hypothetical protein
VVRHKEISSSQLNPKKNPLSHLPKHHSPTFGEKIGLEALGQEPENIADVVEIFEVNVVGDADDTSQSEEPELTLESSD